MFSLSSRNILERDGIFLDDNENIIPSIKICYRCNFINGYDYPICQNCGYPLSQEALNRIKDDEEVRYKLMEEKMMEQMEKKFQQIISNIDMTKLG